MHFLELTSHLILAGKNAWRKFSVVVKSPCCALARCHHFLQTILLSHSVQFAQGHDIGMQHAMEVVVGRVSGSLEQKATAHQIMSFPVRFGGFGISLCRANEARGIVGFLGFPTFTFDRSCFVDRPGWHQLRTGVRPRRGLFPIQRVATWSAVSRIFPIEHHVAHLLSDAGASDVLYGVPTGPEFKVKQRFFRTHVLERLRLPMPVTEVFCECGNPLGQAHGCLSKVRPVAGEGCRS